MFINKKLDKMVFKDKPDCLHGQNISCLGRAQSSTLFLIEYGPNIPYFVRPGQNLQNFSRDCRNIPVYGQDGRNIKSAPRPGFLLSKKNLKKLFFN